MEVQKQVSPIQGTFPGCLVEFSWNSTPVPTYISYHSNTKNISASSELYSELYYNILLHCCSKDILPIYLLNYKFLIINNNLKL